MIENVVHSTPFVLLSPRDSPLTNRPRSSQSGSKRVLRGRRGWGQVRPSPVFPCGSSESVSVPSLGPQVPLPTVGSISRLESHETPWCTRLRDNVSETVTACHTRAIQSPHRMELTSLVHLQGVQLLACANAPRKEAKKTFPR